MTRKNAPPLSFAPPSPYQTPGSVCEGQRPGQRIGAFQKLRNARVLRPTWRAERDLFLGRVVYALRVAGGGARVSACLGGRITTKVFS